MLLHQKTVLHYVFIDYGSTETVEKSIVNKLTEMFLGQKLCDVQFNHEEETSFGAPTLILAFCSPVFSAMFKCGLSEPQSRTVAIDDIDREVFCQLLIYLYTGSEKNASLSRCSWRLINTTWNLSRMSVSVR